MGKYKQELLKLLSDIKNPAFMDALLYDLLTPKEYNDIVLRWQIAKKLHAGDQQRDISRKLKVAIATVTRGSRVLANKNGAFAKILRKELGISHRSERGPAQRRENQ